MPAASAVLAEPLTAVRCIGRGTERGDALLSFVAVQLPDVVDAHAERVFNRPVASVVAHGLNDAQTEIS